MGSIHIIFSAYTLIRDHAPRVMELVVACVVVLISAAVATPNPPTEGCTGHFVLLNNVCYLFDDRHHLSQQEAKEECEWAQSKLLIIENGAESSKLQQHLSTMNTTSHYWWTSLALDMEKCVWRWNLDKKNGASMTYADWCSEDEENCVVYNPDSDKVGMVFGPDTMGHKWSIKPQVEQLPFICKAPVAKIAEKSPYLED